MLLPGGVECALCLLHRQPEPIEGCDEGLLQLGQTRSEQRLKALEIGTDPHHGHGGVVAGHRGDVALNGLRPCRGAARSGQGLEDEVFEVHRRLEVAETTVCRAHDQERRLQLHPSVAHLEVGVGRHGVADHRVEVQVGHGVAAVSEVVGAELVSTSRGEDVGPRVAGAEHVTGPGRSAAMCALQGDHRHRGGQRAEQFRAEPAGWCLQFGEPILQGLPDRAAKILGRRPAVQIPVRLEQVQHPVFDDIPGDPRRQVGAGTRSVRCVVDRPAGATHPVEDADQAQIRPVPNDRIGVFPVVSDLGQVEGE